MLKFQQTVILGLGPSGKRFLEFFKQRIGASYGELPAIMLLALDMPAPDQNVAGGAAEAVNEILSPTELIELTIDDVIDSPQDVKVRYPWLPDQVANKEEEWVTTRAAARVALHLNFRTIQEFLEFHLGQLGTVAVRDRMAEAGFDLSADRNEANLIVVGALGEPTGSGLLLDTTYMLHHLFSRIGMQVASTGLLFMPPLNPTDEQAEAVAYATLKELDEIIDQQHYTTHLKGIRELNIAPFNYGCYLIDSRNERMLSLQNHDEVLRLSAEWLFGIIISSLKGEIDNFVADQGATARNQGRVACYSSLGLASIVLPVNALIEYSANRLGGDLIMQSILASELYEQVRAQLSDFLTLNSLGHKELREKLAIGNEGPIQKDKTIERPISGMMGAPFEQLENIFRQAIEGISATMPKLDRTVEANTRSKFSEFSEGLSKEIRSILRANPKGGLSLSFQFVTRLLVHFDNSSKALDRREEVVKAKNHAQSARLNVAGSALKKAVSGVPKLSTVFIAGLAGGLAPLLLMTFWLVQTSSDLGWFLTAFLILLVWAFFLGGAFYAYQSAINCVTEARDKCINELHSRFQTEVSLLLIRRARLLYPDMMDEVSKESARLQSLQSKIQSLATTFKNSLDEQSMCGEVGFAMQRSVLTEDIIDELYEAELGKGEARLAPMLQEMGMLDTWLDKKAEELEKGILTYGRKVFIGMNNLRVEDLLQKQIPGPQQAERKVRELQDLAAPLWQINNASLGQYSTSLSQTYVVLDRENSVFQGYFVALNPTAHFQTQGDPHNLIVTTIRNGIPLFALNRIDQFRENYLDYVRSGELPLHIEDDLSLAPDLILPEAGETRPLDTASAFAVGRALEFLKPSETGCWTVYTPAGKVLKTLANEKINSAVLLGVDDRLLSALSKDIEEKISELGGQQVNALLQDYLSTADITSWERSGIEKYITLQLQR